MSELSLQGQVLDELTRTKSAAESVGQAHPVLAVNATTVSVDAADPT